MLLSSAGRHHTSRQGWQHYHIRQQPRRAEHPAAARGDLLLPRHQPRGPGGERPHTPQHQV